MVCHATFRSGMSVFWKLDTSQNLDPRRLVRQAAFCDPQIPQYFAVLENNFPTSQLGGLEVLRGVQFSEDGWQKSRPFRQGQTNDRGDSADHPLG